MRENRGKLFNSSKTAVTARSGNEWDGEIEYKRAKYSELARENTAKVIKAVRADVACIDEAEDRPTLKGFDSDLLNYRFKYEMLLDGNEETWTSRGSPDDVAAPVLLRAGLQDADGRISAASGSIH